MTYEEVKPNEFVYEYDQGKVILKFKGGIKADFQIYAEDDNNTVHVNIINPDWRAE